MSPFRLLLCLTCLSPALLLGSRAPAQIATHHHRALAYMSRVREAHVQAAGPRFCFAANQLISSKGTECIALDAQAPLFFTMTKNAQGLKIAEKLAAELNASWSKLPLTEIAPFISNLLFEEKPRLPCPHLAMALIADNRLFLASLGKARVFVSKKAGQIVANVFEAEEEDENVPAIHILPISEDDKLIVLASRGITRALENADPKQKADANAAIAAIAKEVFATHKSCEAVASVLVDSAVAQNRWEDASAVAMLPPTRILRDSAIPSVPLLPAPPPPEPTPTPHPILKFITCSK